MAEKAEWKPTVGLYTVYCVDAGDRMTLVQVVDGKPVFRPVMLSFIHCPKMGRRQPNGELSEDEPCAYDAMEFVRSRIIGRTIKFIDHFMVEPLKRVSGNIELQDSTDITVSLLKAGLATIPPRAPPKMEKALHEEYVAYQTIARGSKLGIYARNADSRCRLVYSHPPDDAQGFADAMKGKSVKVRVDRVASGTGLLLHVANPQDDLEFQALQAVMTGAQANPTADRLGSPDPLGQAAKAHTERFLLHRAITARFEGLDGNGNYCVSIVNPNHGTFQSELVGRGLAKVNHSTIEKTADKDAILAAESKAREARLGIWGGEEEANSAAAQDATEGKSAGVESKARVPVSQQAPKLGETPEQTAAKPPMAYKGDADFDGVVVQIVNGDTMGVRNSKTGEVVRLSLAGVRAPKVSNRDTNGNQRDGSRPPEVRVSHEDYTWEAKEFLRTSFIGQVVRVHVEYARVMDADSKDLRAMATVHDVESGVNVGAAVLRQGLAKFFLGRTDVCSCETELKAAEASAVEAGRGIHNEAQRPPTTRITELNRLGEKQGRHYLGFINRSMQGKRPPSFNCVVESVMSGSSVRVYIPREHLQLTLKLAGIVTPSNFQEQNDPFADESRDFAIRTLQQREAEVMIETVDRGGNFIGYLHVRGKNFASSMLAEGLAICSGADRTLFASEYGAAENVARKAKKFIWSDQGAIPAQAQRRAAQAAARNYGGIAYRKADAAQAQWTKVYVSNVEDSNSLHIVPVTQDLVSKQQTLAELIAAIVDEAPGKKYTPKRNELVLVQYKEDAQWYRGKVSSISDIDRRAEVQFIDYGNVVQASFKELREIPTSNPTYSPLRAIPALAKPAKLAWLKPHRGYAEVVADASAIAWEYLGDVSTEMYAKLEYIAEGVNTHYYTVSTAPDAGAPTLQEVLVKEGFAIVDRGAAAVDAKAVSQYVKTMDGARLKHSGMWINGNCEDDADDDE